MENSCGSLETAKVVLQFRYNEDINFLDRKAIVLQREDYDLPM